MPPGPAIEGYRDFRRVAIGGFSTVYTAYQERFARTVAVKVLSADVGDAAALRRFTRECQASGRLSHLPEIITVYDAGATTDDQPFIAMQYFPRGSLVDRMRDNNQPNQPNQPNRLSAPETVGVGVSVARALAAAHRADITHRDIKPGNLLVSDDGGAVLSDIHGPVAGPVDAVSANPDSARQPTSPAAPTAPAPREPANPPPRTGSGPAPLPAPSQVPSSARPSPQPAPVRGCSARGEAITDYAGRAFSTRYYCSTYVASAVYANVRSDQASETLDDSGYMAAAASVWALCQYQGRPNPVIQGNTNTWWLYTQGDNGRANTHGYTAAWGYLPATAVSQGEQDEPVPGVPLCPSYF
ncbi:hypothetical protein FrCorBMG51_05240 [Protofrankia coriariae]|uniref:non-specific serine/threonine protein kinase n=1 Tax=Protofrankia coriariae TaxID=1562887 RepID=A0ABR5F6P9_9ACTN|nr:hypothetical protein FrCorBMG51_05240 [Protofrankia coriariae]